jgi:transcriptional regulator GlxA family with amidase domain
MSALLRVGFVGFDQLTALDLVGPAEAFSTAVLKRPDGKLRNVYEVFILGLTSRPFVSESGIVFQPRCTLQAAPKLNTIVIPGGRGLRDADVSRRIANWIKSRASQTRRIVSVCTGIYGLAPTGLLDGRHVTTHWRFAADVAARFPKLKVNANALFLKAGRFYTSAGVTAGIDLALALIEQDFGRECALAVARDLVVYLKRTGGQEQYSEPLQFQAQSIDRLSETASWISSNPGQNLSIDALAGRACLSRRHFIRRFKAAFGQPPGIFVQARRLDEARRRLCGGKASIEAVADSVGFKSVDAFRRAFTHRFRVTPSKYQRSFGRRDNNHIHQCA